MSVVYKLWSLVTAAELSETIWELGGVLTMESESLLGLDDEWELQMEALVLGGYGTFSTSVNMGPSCMSTQ